MVAAHPDKCVGAEIHVTAQQTGIIIAWASNAMLLVFILVAYFSQRCKYAPLVKTYAIVLLLLSFIYKAVPGFFTWDFFLQLRAADYLLIAGAVINLWRISSYRQMSQSWWFTRDGLLADLRANWWAPLLLVTALFGAYGYYTELYLMLHPVTYYLPRVLLFGAIAFGLPAAIRRFDLLYISFATMASGMLVADALKLFDSYANILVIQRTLDPAIALLSKVVLIAALFQAEIYRAWYGFKSRRKMRAEETVRDAVAVEAGTGQSSVMPAQVEVAASFKGHSDFDKLLDIYQISKLIKQDINAAKALVRLNGLKSTRIGGTERWLVEEVRKAAGI